MRDLGYVEGRNIRIEYRWAEGQYERLPPLIADLMMKRYRPGENEAFQLHFDAIHFHSNRYLVMLWYLNGVAQGGETSFPQLELAVKPETGLAAKLRRQERGATGIAYKIRPQDRGKRITVEVTGRAPGYETTVKTSAATASVRA